MSVRVLSVLVCGFCCSLSGAEEIPLNQIWGLNIPGTKDVRDLEPENEKFDGMTYEKRVAKSLVSNTGWLLSSRFLPPHGSNAGPGFVVAGTGLEALKEANAILAKKNGRIEHFPSGQKLTLVLFSYSSPRRFQLDKVTKNNNEVTVSYRLLNPGLLNSTKHFALIPIGSFKKGTVSVRMKLLPGKDYSESDLVDDFRIASRIFSDSFSFGIVEKEN